MPTCPLIIFQSCIFTIRNSLNACMISNVSSILLFGASMLDGALNFREAYMDYIPNCPIAAYRIDEEMASNPAFKEFVEVRH